MSNASGPLRSLGDSLDSLRQRMTPTDERKFRVLRCEITAYSLASSLSDDQSSETIEQIVRNTNAVATLNSTNNARFETVVSEVENMLLNLSSE